MFKTFALGAATSPPPVFITIEELIHELLQYLPTIADYRHESLRIDCDRFYRNTTVDLFGQLDDKRGRRVWLRVTIDDIATTNLSSELGPGEFVIRLDSPDLALEQCLVVRPRPDRSIDFIQVLRWERGQPVLAGPVPRLRCAVVKGDHAFRLSVTGVKNCQQDLAGIVASGSGGDGRHLVPALLVPEPFNHQRRDAVAVQIEKRTIGYMERELAVMFLEALSRDGFHLAACGAAILAKRQESTRQLEFSVRLDAILPFVLMDRPAFAATSRKG
jgi:hypothetical protein